MRTPNRSVYLGSATLTNYTIFNYYCQIPQ
nr:MAG TPA: hypothetical protein [Bacteriophage sp.]